MKASMARLWHGFVYGIGFSVAWWLVFGILGYALFDQFISDYFNIKQSTEQQQQTQSVTPRQSNEAVMELKKRLDAIEDEQARLVAPTAEH